MVQVLPICFDQAGLRQTLDALTDGDLDALAFGVIGFASDTLVDRYNAYESECAGLLREQVVGKPLFATVAPCMNNYLVAQRFEDAAAAGEPLDDVVAYVLTLRMRPVKVRLRLLAAADGPHRYVLVERPARA